MEREAPVRRTTPTARINESIVERLRRRDEDAFREVVEAHSRLMFYVARAYVRDAAVAEEVVQEAWLAFVGHIDHFEERSSLKTWILRILTNKAATRAAHERKTIAAGALRDEERAVEPSRFLPEDHPTDARWWSSYPRVWPIADPEALLRSGEIRSLLEAAIAALPEQQRVVLVLRDIEGWSAEDVCAALDLSAPNQRVLLHRGRAKVRRALERYFEEESR